MGMDAIALNSLCSRKRDAATAEVPEFDPAGGGSSYRAGSEWLVAIDTPAERRASGDPPTVITFRMPGGGLLGLPQLSATARMTG